MIRIPKSLLAAAAFACVAIAANAASAGGPPPDLVALERSVNLHLAHERASESADAARFKQVADAQKLDYAAEQAIAAGDYKTASRDLLDADAILRELDR